MPRNQGKYSSLIRKDELNLATSGINEDRLSGHGLDIESRVEGQDAHYIRERYFLTCCVP